MSVHQLLVVIPVNNHRTRPNSRNGVQCSTDTQAPQRHKHTLMSTHSELYCVLLCRPSLQIDVIMKRLGFAVYQTRLDFVQKRKKVKLISLSSLPLVPYPSSFLFQLPLLLVVLLLFFFFFFFFLFSHLHFAMFYCQEMTMTIPTRHLHSHVSSNVLQI